MPRTRDIMGYQLAPVMALFSREEVRAARRLAKAHGYAWDCVGTDPRVCGWRFLRDAKLTLSRRDLGDRCPHHDRSKGAPA